MLEILRSMAKEEWRIHSSIFGSAMFGLFPVLIGLFTFGFSLFIPMFEAVISLSDMYTLIHYLALLVGASIGAFALFGREVMNRRFGQASMVAYSSRTLPVTDRRIMMNVMANDIGFYFMLYIIPFFVGFSGAALFTGAVPAFSPMLLATITLSFLIGMSVIFLMSTIYVHSSRFFVTLMAVLGAALVLGGQLMLGLDVLQSLPSLEFFRTGAAEPLLHSLFWIIVPAAVSMAFLRIEAPERARRVRNSLDGLSKAFGRLFDDPHLISKDFLDLQRSEGGIGKIFFSFIFPLVLIWAMLYIFTGLFSVPQSVTFLAFSVLVGALSSSIYNWLTEFDIFSSYAFLPVRVSDVIKGKLKGYLVLDAGSVAIIAAASALSGQLMSLPAGLFAFAIISAYSVSVTVYLAGLSPNVLIYSARTFLGYCAALVPCLVLAIISSLMNPLLLLASMPPFIALSFVLLRKGFAKWDSLEQPIF
jgi:hypothetical protein